VQHIQSSLGRGPVHRGIVVADAVRPPVNLE